MAILPRSLRERGERPIPVFSEAEILSQIERDLSEPRFRGVPVGPGLADLINIEVAGNPRVLDAQRRWKDRARWLKHWYCPRHRKVEQLRQVPRHRIIITRPGGGFSLTEMIMPVLFELGKENCLVLCEKPASLPLLPSGTQGVAWDDVMCYDVLAGAATFASIGRGGKRSSGELAGTCACRKAPSMPCRCRSSWSPRTLPVVLIS